MEAGESGHEAAVLPLLDDPVWSVRRQACMALERMGTTRSRIAVEEVAANDPNRAVRSRALYVIATIKDSRSLPVVERLLTSPDWDVRGVAADQIRYFVDSRVVPLLRNLAEHDPVNYVRIRAAGSVDYLIGSTTPGPAAPAATEPDAGWNRFWIVLAASLLAFVIFRRCSRRTLIVFAVFFLIGFTLVFSAPLDDQGSVILSFDPQLLDAPIFGTAVDPRLVLEDLRDSLAAAGIPIRSLEAFNGSLETAHEKNRDQYDADSVLLAVDTVDGHRVLLTYRDIYNEPFHHALGYARPGAGVFSARRIDPVFLAEGPGDTADLEIFRERLFKLCLHELAHLYRVGHCTRPGCVMNSIELPEQFFRLEPRLCEECEDTFLASSVAG